MTQANPNGWTNEQFEELGVIFRGETVRDDAGNEFKYWVQIGSRVGFAKKD